MQKRLMIVTAFGKMKKPSMAMRRPQAAPTKAVGMKTPKLTFRPNVRHDRK